MSTPQQGAPPPGYTEVPAPTSQPPKGYKEVPAPIQQAQPSQPEPTSPISLQLTEADKLGPATPNPAEEAMKRPADQPTKDWLLNALLAPGTYFGSFLHPHAPTKDEIRQEKLTSMPHQGSLPLIDPSIGMEPGFFKGAAQGAGGLTTLSQIPLLAFTPESKAVSGLFAAMTAPQILAKYPEYSALKDKGKDAEANQVLGEMAVLGAMGTLAGFHAAGGGDRLSTLSKDEQSYLVQTLKDHYQGAIKEDISGQPKFQQVSPGAAESEAIHPEQPIPNARGQEPAPPNAPSSGVETLRDDTGVTGGEGPTSTDSIERAEQERAGREASERELGTESIEDMELRLRGVPVTEDNIASIQAILPEFNKLIGGGEEEGAHPSNREAETGAYPATEDEPPLPVISRAVDDDNAAHGLNIVRRGRDINVISRFLLSFNETARKLNEEGHPLGPVLKSMSGIISDVTKNIAVNQTDTIKSFINGAQKLVSRDEWTNQVVPLMDRQVPNRPEGTPDHIWNAYQAARSLDESLRVKILTAKRKELQLNGFTPEQAQEWYPDTWGRQGEHYPHLHPGTWTITRLAEVDEKGNEIYEPISHPEISWRATSELEAKKAAQAYLESNPNEQLRVRQDTVSLPGSGITDRTRLRELNDKIKEATTTIVQGGADPKEVLDQLYDQSGAAAYGPRNPAKRQFGPSLKRETNLEGWTKDIDDFRDYLMAGERYVQLAPARQMLMKARNQIAQIAGMPQVQKVGEFPAPSKYFSAAQYGNILARVDSAIEGLEGHPGAWDAGARYIASGMGFDPDIIAKMSRPIQQVVALMKLGFQPARILSHGMQTLWAVYPVLGEEHTLSGIAHSFDSAHDNLIHDLGVTHSGNMSDIEGLREYAGAYFGRGASPLDMTKGAAHIIRDLGLLPFTMGIDFTRRVAAVGGYLQGLDRGMDEAGARAYARNVMDRTTGMYNAADNATLLRQLPGPVSQFKGFMFKTMQFMANLRGAELARFGAIISLMGVVGFPAIKALSNMIEQATGENLENDLKRKFPVASRGVFGALGVDQPSAVGFADWFASRPGIPLGGAAGPAGSDALNFAKAGLERFKGPSRQADQDLDQAIRQLSPEGRRVWDEAIRGTRLPEPGLIDPRTGASILHQLTPLERLEAVAGFTPLRVAEERESHEYIRNQLMQAKDQRGFFVDKLAENQIELMRPGLTSNQKADLLKETLDLQKLAAEYNQAHNLVPAVRDRIKGMMQERLSRDIRKAPKAERPMIEREIQRYQNQQER